MTSGLARLYAVLAGVVAFFLSWAAVAAHPWAPRAARDPRIAALVAREQRVQAESIRVRHIVAQRARAARGRTASAPVVRVVNLPPLVLTRTS